jgi:hypothetical protein
MRVQVAGARIDVFVPERVSSSWGARQQPALRPDRRIDPCTSDVNGRGRS